MGKNVPYRNIGLLAAAFVFLAYASFTLTPASLRQNTNVMLAAVGMSAGVAPNQYNTLAAELNAKEAELNQREAQLNAEGYGSAPGTAGIAAIPPDRYGFYSLCISAALFVLVAINFYYDVRRRKNTGSAGGFSVDLR